jgi:sRNA-binding regulator protein Hfq
MVLLHTLLRQLIVYQHAIDQTQLLACCLDRFTASRQIQLFPEIYV